MKNKTKKPRTTNGGAILRKRYPAKNKELTQMVANHRVNLEIAQQIYDLRTKSGYTQEEYPSFSVRFLSDSPPPGPT